MGTLWCMYAWFASDTMRQRASEVDDVSEILTMNSAFVQTVHATLGIVPRIAEGAGGRRDRSPGVGCSDAVRSGFVRDGGGCELSTAFG
jgi:hypothetical protein